MVSYRLWRWTRAGSAVPAVKLRCLVQKRNFTGLHFWATGYCVSTVGLDEQVIRAYIRNQEETEKRSEKMRLEGLYVLSMRQLGPLWGPSPYLPLCGW